MNLATLPPFVLAAPVALVAVALLSRAERGPRPTRVLAASRAATLLGLAVAVATGLLVAAGGPATQALLVKDGLGFALRLDALSAVMLGLVAFLGAVVVQFSRNYVAGDARHGAFLGNLCLTVAAVEMLVLSGNLVQLVVAWMATSFALHELLVFYPERRGAVVAAKKKFLVARIGDVCLVAAAVLLVRAFGTGDLAEVLAHARATASAPPGGVALAACHVAVSAALKSAMFPTHGWLAEVMETPTPVSALLHAGILNGGTFLVVRLGDAVVTTPAALQLLVAVGGFTAMFASVVMVTQPTVKGSLAYSSAAHMGFMLLLCGMGAWSVAIMHLVAHSCYKAHAFLSSGSAIDAARPVRQLKGARQVPPGRIALAIVLAFASYVGVGLAMGVPLHEKPVTMALGAMLVMALSHLVAQGANGKALGVLLRSVLAAATTALAFFALEIVGSRLLAGAVPEAPKPITATVVVAALVILGFGTVTTLQLLLPSLPRSPFWRAAWVHVRNGFYANAAFDRVVGAIRR